MNEPQLPAEMEKRFDKEFDHFVLDVGESGETVDWDRVKHFLATALEEQRQELLSEVDEAITKRVLPAPLYGNYKEDRLHQRWQAELNQLKGKK